MSICDNSLLISFNSLIQIRVHFTRFEHCQVSICDNSLAKTFIFGFLELFYFSFLYRFIVIICPPSSLRLQPSGPRPQASGFMPHDYDYDYDDDYDYDYDHDSDYDYDLEWTSCW